MTSQNLDAVAELLRSFFEIANQPGETVHKRRRSLRIIGEHFECQAVVWSWGVGTTGSNPVVPVAILDWGMSLADRTHFINFGLHPKTDVEFRDPIRRRSASARCITTLRQDLMSDSQWQASNMRAMLGPTGWDEWLHSVNNPSADAWSTLLLFRNTGASPFGETERDKIQLLMTSVPWLDADCEVETPEPHEQPLTSRQRTVMLMLLDGLTRKAIAASLGIHEDTVGDHIKAIFRHYRVRSVTELAALFLQSK